VLGGIYLALTKLLHRFDVDTSDLPEVPDYDDLWLEDLAALEVRDA